MAENTRAALLGAQDGERARQAAEEPAAKGQVSLKKEGSTEVDRASAPRTACDTAGMIGQCRFSPQRRQRDPSTDL
jgi:hypothetical protein